MKLQEASCVGDDFTKEIWLFTERTVKKLGKAQGT